MLGYVPDHLTMQQMCDKVVGDYLFFLQLVPDWFVTKQQVDIWYDDNYVYDDNEMIEWYEGYKKRKAQKASIKEKLMPISWHGEDEKKKRQKNCGHKHRPFLYLMAG